MKMKSETILFFGNERLATGVSTIAPTLQKLIGAGYTISAVVVNNERAQSRKSRELEIATVARKHDITVIAPQKLTEIKNFIQNSGADIGVLVAYGKIIPQWLIDLFPKGIINIHPSLLPQHRGPTPIENAILHGDHQTAVSIMNLTSAMDAGPVFVQKLLSLNGTESKQSLADELLELGGNLLLEVIPKILDGSLSPVQQVAEDATYDALISKPDGIIDWSKPALQITREVRAYAGWPKSVTQIASKDVVVVEAKPCTVQLPSLTATGLAYRTEKSELLVSCSDGLVEIKRIKPAGKQEMSAESFIAGYGKGIPKV